MKALLLLLPWLMAAQDTASVEGVVVNSVTGAPVRRAFVALIGAGADANKTAVTDLEGRFSAAGLKPGIYLAQAVHANFQPYGQHSRPQEVRIAPGENRISLRLDPPGGISGRVLDPDGEPLPRASFQILRPGRVDGRIQVIPVQSGATDDRGVYRAGALPAGRYYVHVSARPSLPVRRPLTPRSEPRPPQREAWPALFYPGSTDMSEATPVRVAPGIDTDGIDFKLHRTSTIRIRGKVTGVEAANELSWTMGLVPRDSILRESGPAGVMRSAWQFEFPSVPAGPYNLWIKVVANRKTLFWAEVPIEARTRDIDDLVVAVMPASDILGRVRLGREPLAGMNVMLIPRGPVDRREPAGTAADGTFRIDQVPAGEYRLMVYGKQPVYVQSATLAGQPVPRGWFEIPSGSAGPLEIVAGNSFATLRGTVDVPLGTVVVAVGEGEWRTTTVSGDGVWSLGELAPGRYQVGAVPIGVENDPELADLAERRGQTVKLDEGASVTLELRRITPP